MKSINFLESLMNFGDGLDELWILIEMLCLTKCVYIISLRYVFGERDHILTEAITERSRAMAIVVTVVTFRSPSGRGYNQSFGI